MYQEDVSTSRCPCTTNRALYFSVEVPKLFRQQSILPQRGSALGEISFLYDTKHFASEEAVERLLNGS